MDCPVCARGGCDIIIIAPRRYRQIAHTCPSAVCWIKCDDHCYLWSSHEGKKYLHPGVGSTFTEHVARDVARGQATQSTQDQHNLRVVLAYTSSQRQGLGGRRMDVCFVVFIRQRFVYPFVDVVNQGWSSFPAVL